MRKILQKILYILAKLILARYKPKIIGITGSVGKTSTKEAIFTVLKSKYTVRTNIKNYNNEIGLPLTIINSTAAGKNIFKWFYIFSKALVVLIYWPYPEILILEMGADKPGDIKYLVNLAPCFVGVLTAIGKNPAHLEFYKNIDQLIKEKANIITHLNKDNWAVINIDDENLINLQEKTVAQIITVGISDQALIKVEDINYTSNLEEDFKNNVAGLNFKINYQGNIVPFKLKNCLGTPQAYAALNAIACGIIFKMNLVEIAQALKNYLPPLGRLNILEGIKDTIILDDSYNSSPTACQQALELLSTINVSGRKIACLSNMEELGEESSKVHRQIGRIIANLNIDVLFTVGDKAAEIAEAATEKSMNKENVHIYEDADLAKKAIEQEMHRGDVILIKGSQKWRMEKVVKEIMLHPELAEKLLVRQDRLWQNK